jgi:hypothetical protein
MSVHLDPSPLKGSTKAKSLYTNPLLGWMVQCQGSRARKSGVRQSSREVNMGAHYWAGHSCETVAADSLILRAVFREAEWTMCLRWVYPGERRKMNSRVPSCSPIGLSLPHREFTFLYYAAVFVQQWGLPEPWGNNLACGLLHMLWWWQQQWPGSTTLGVVKLLLGPCWL